MPFHFDNERTMKRNGGTQSVNATRLVGHDHGGPRVPTQHHEQRNQHIGADVGNSGCDAASLRELHNSRNAARSSPLPVPTAYSALDIPTSCSAAELRGPGGRPAMAAYPSSHFATHRTAHGFRGGMSCAKR